MNLTCHFEETLTIFVQSIRKVIDLENAIYGQISDEEWEAIRLSKRERRDNVNELVRKKLVNSTMCSRCLRWSLMAVETWALRYSGSHALQQHQQQQNDATQGKQLRQPVVNQVATWEPTNGLLMSDVLFPHVSHGFRGQKLPVVAYHVRGLSMYSTFRKTTCFLFIFQNPPWQYIQYNEAGEIVSTRGIVVCYQIVIYC